MKKNDSIRSVSFFFASLRLCAKSLRITNLGH